MSPTRIAIEDVQPGIDGGRFPAHILPLRRTVRTERDFDYFPHPAGRGGYGCPTNSRVRWSSARRKRRPRRRSGSGRVPRLTVPGPWETIPKDDGRIKRLPLRDVAGMLRSFHYAAKARLVGAAGGGAIRAEDLAALDPWARYWNRWVSAVFLRAYRETASRGTFLPKSREELSAPLDACLVGKAIYELECEPDNRPDRAKLPLRGILALLETGE